MESTNSMSSGIIINTAAFEANLARFAKHSKKAGEEVMKDQARLLFVEVARITPPNGGKKDSEGKFVHGRAAETQGKLAITRDYHFVYGTPGRAYSDLQRKSTQQMADAFWSHQKKGNVPEARAILRKGLKKDYNLFDGGKSAKRFKGKKRTKEPLFYISNPNAMNYFIAQEQEHVWYLASGWAPALKQLGVKTLPYGVGKHNAPGLLKVEITDSRILISMTNRVQYAGQVKGLQDQVKYAMNYRTTVLQKSWDDWMKRLSGEK